MTLKSGMASSLGIAAEVTWSVPVAPTIHLPFLEESITQENERTESEGIIAGQRVLRSQQWAPGRNTVGGDIGLELCDRSMSLLFEHMFGTTADTYTVTPGDLTGKGLTVQVLRPSTTAGTVHPFTFSGGKVASWELGLSEGEIATLGLTFMFRHEIRYRTVADGATTNASATVTSATAVFTEADKFKPISGVGTAGAAYIGVINSPTSVDLSSTNNVHTPVGANATATGQTFTIGLALTSPSYAANIAPISFVGASVTLAGSAFKVKNLTLSGDNGLEERRFANDTHTDEPLETSLREYGGTLETEFFDMTAYNRFVNGTEAALVISLAKGTSTVVITTNVRFDGDSPNVGGRGVVEQSLPFKCVGASTDAGAITAVLSAA